MEDQLGELQQHGQRNNLPQEKILIRCTKCQKVYDYVSGLLRNGQFKIELIGKVFEFLLREWV